MKHLFKLTTQPLHLSTSSWQQYLFPSVLLHKKVNNKEVPSRLYFIKIQDHLQIGEKLTFILHNKNRYCIKIDQGYISFNDDFWGWKSE